MVQTAVAFTVRPMRPGDISQVLEVEREAFPTLWPPSSFKRELNNKLARYIVAVEEKLTPSQDLDSEDSTGAASVSSLAHPSRDTSLDGRWQRWAQSFRRLLPSGGDS
ncbi:MAG: hypothetical protein ACE5JL_12625, partial [Dehalococcoidia bacterium]